MPQKVKLEVEFDLPDGMEVPDFALLVRMLVFALKEKFPIYHNSRREMSRDDYFGRLAREVQEYSEQEDAMGCSHKAINIANIALMAAEIERMRGRLTEDDLKRLFG